MKRALLAALLGLQACTPARDERASPEGTVVVTEVTKGLAAAAAGLVPGDVLLTWERGASSGPLATPFDVELLEIREAPRGKVSLRGRRGSQQLAVTLPHGPWGLLAAPRVEPDPASAWAAYHSAREAAEAREWERANAAFGEAATRAGRAGDESATALIEREAGFALGRQARLLESRVWHERSLARREATSPDGLEVAASLLDLAIVAVLLNELDPADRLAKRSLAIVEREAPGSLLLGTVLGFVGLIQEKRGDLAAHEAMRLRALAAQEALDPEGVETAATLHNLGNLVRRRGDLARAEGYFRRALAIRQRLPPDRQLAYTVLALGHVARARGDGAAAREAYERALELIREHGPDATAEGVLQVSLGNVAFDREDFAAAAARYEDALAVFRAATPDGSGVIHTLGQLGEAALRLGDAGRARALHREALGIVEKAAPAGLDAARCLFLLAEVDRAEARWRAAESLLRRALALQERAAPETAAHAEILHRLGLALWRTGRAAEAATLLTRATQVLDAQQGRLGGPDEAAARFRARYLQIYRDAMELQIEQGRTGDAFETLERSRAAALRQQLAQRDLDLRKDLPADLDARRRAAAVEYERVQRQLAELPPSAPPERVNGLLSELRALRDRRQQVQDEVRRAAPRLGALREAMGLRDAAASLEAGTVALSFAVGERATHAFVLRGDGGLDVARIEAGEAALRGEVERFRLLLAAPGPGEEARTAILARGRALYERLLSPVEAHIGRADTLLVLPDGPLHLLPFAALVRPGSPPRFVAEWKPLYGAASFTVRSLLHRAGPSERDVLAFGDVPASSDASAPLPGSRMEAEAVAARFGGRGRALVGPAASERRFKQEGPRARLLHLAVHGVLDDRLPMDSGLVLAADGGPSGENGFLQAWEILEQVRLEAELVTLSGCETGLGAQVAGEGILGLTSALHYAGADAVLASLWKVSDRSTALLMERFYDRLAAGVPKPRALQAAQADLMHGPVAGLDPPRRGLAGLIAWPLQAAAPPALDASHPHHWAAFQLSGDAR